MPYAQLQSYCERFAPNRNVTGGTAVVDTAARTVKQSLKDLERAVPAPHPLTLETR